MAQETGTVGTYGIVGIREDFANIISNVDPTDKPFQSMIGSEKCANTYFSWQKDNFRAASTNNAHIEGDEYAYVAPDPTERIGNHTQILREEVMVSKTADAVNKAGRNTELARLVTKKGVELSLDREKILLNNQASSAGTSTTARTMGAFPAWLETNALRAADGADGGFNSTTNIVDAATDSTSQTRSYTETLLKDLLQQVYENSRGFPGYLFKSPFHKRKFSGFAGISQLRSEARGTGKKGLQAAIIAGADMYVSDWGPVTVIVDRFMRNREVFAVNPMYVKRRVLRPMNTVTPAETSDASKRVIICEESLEVTNEAAHGVLADLTTNT